MVSPLWNACSEGRQEQVQELLQNASLVDIELEDHTGATPLIEAIKNGHVEIVRALLDKGADPTHPSSQGPPEQYTSNTIILELLQAARNKPNPSGMSPHVNGYASDVDPDAEKSAYQPTTIYANFPTLTPVPPPMTQGTVYYPPPPPSQSTPENQVQGGSRNLPPPDVARLIPCRYFPACRYGSSCMFLHPQGPYFPGPLPPPAQYPVPYDPMAPQPYPPNYYLPQPPYQPPNGAHMTPVSTPPTSLPPMMHTMSNSEAVPPPQAPFSPQAAPPPPLPYGPMPNPAAYHPPPVPIPVPMQQLPPAHPQAQGPQSPPAMYNGTVQPPYPLHHDAAGQHPPQNMAPPLPIPADSNVAPKTSAPHVDSYAPVPPTYRDGPGHSRRGSGRRGSTGNRKPPCFFFPAGRCRNGDDCRYPHIMPDPAGFPYNGRSGGPRSKPHVNGNGVATIEEKFAGMSIQDNGHFRPNGVDGRPAERTRFQGLRTNQTAVNASRADKKPVVRQRVPNADEFPVLAGAVTPPARSPGANGSLNGLSGPTAAQVLRAPPPVRRDSARESNSTTRSATPDSSKAAKSKDTKQDMNDMNGLTPDAPRHDLYSVQKLPVSFVAVATSTASVPDVVKEVSVSA